MRGGVQTVWILFIVAGGMLLYARLSDPRGWSNAWFKAYANVRFGVVVVWRLVVAGSVVVWWSARPAREWLAGVLARRAVRHAPR